MRELGSTLILKQKRKLLLKEPPVSSPGRQLILPIPAAMPPLAAVHARNYECGIRSRDGAEPSLVVARLLAADAPGAAAVSGRPDQGCCGLGAASVGATCWGAHLRRTVGGEVTRLAADAAPTNHRAGRGGRKILRCINHSTPPRRLGLVQDGWLNFDYIDYAWAIFGSNCSWGSERCVGRTSSPNIFTK